MFTNTAKFSPSCHGSLRATRHEEPPQGRAMLQALRNGVKSPIMKVFLIFLAGGFALWGVGDMTFRCGAPELFEQFLSLVLVDIHGKK